MPDYKPMSSSRCDKYKPNSGHKKRRGDKEPKAARAKILRAKQREHVISPEIETTRPWGMPNASSIETERLVNLVQMPLLLSQSVSIAGQVAPPLPPPTTATPTTAGDFTASGEEETVGPDYQLPELSAHSHPRTIEELDACATKIIESSAHKLPPLYIRAR
ncbi:hypothetical protein AOL_s00088g43 [Orbilia oligospora ATCC 24927]|uniref:Uncharacterized protein n=1 Tax=Arthrobotrys oligospora (strain ATCC 24927 / CBS 115.81 / DSM 1491) TaxID=756982 RepID=G1XHT0_ARTOA|nr:hypothetical protein AOL_s00088g43 [Orbilia oligospora ATCC 24927]EGX47328.1 hypothetical protein AOL_s00088g43 [Orbilia oligospora ATCC 24927]